MKEKSTRYRNYNTIQVFITSYVLLDVKKDNVLGPLHQDSFLKKQMYLKIFLRMRKVGDVTFI